MSFNPDLSAVRGCDAHSVDEGTEAQPSSETRLRSGRHVMQGVNFKLPLRMQSPWAHGDLSLSEPGVT